MLEMPIITSQTKEIKQNVLQLAGLRRSIPSPLRDKDCLPPLNPPTFVIDEKIYLTQLQRSQKNSMHYLSGKMHNFLIWLINYRVILILLMTN